MRISDWSSDVCSSDLHADLGGIAPGSMPPDSKSIDDEGILFDNFLLVDDGHFRDAKVHAHLTAGDWPARRSEEHTSELQSLMRISYAVFCLQKKNTNSLQHQHQNHSLHIYLHYKHSQS